MAWMSKEVKEEHRKLVEQVVADMEAGKPFFWDSGHYGRPPRNILPNNEKGHEGEDRFYRGINNMLLTFEAKVKGYKDSRWGTYGAIKTAGGQVRKGEKSTLIECWVWEKPLRQKNAKGEMETVYQKDEKGNILKDRFGKKKPVMVHLKSPLIMTYRVFNAEQADGLSPEHPITIDLADRNEKMEMILANSEAKIIHDQISGNFYRPSADEIHLMKREEFKSMDDYYATATHEIAHSTGHEQRLKRKSLMESQGFGTPTYAKEELCAEMASMFLRQEYGLKFDEKHRDNHGAYLRSWVEALKKNPDELYLAASEAEKAVRYIRENMLERGLKKAKEKDVGNVVNAARSAKKRRLKVTPHKVQDKEKGRAVGMSR